MSSHPPGNTAVSHDVPTVVKPHIYPFLDLPAELRNQIYSYVFGDRLIVICPDPLKSNGVTGEIYPGTGSDCVNAENVSPRRPFHTFALLKTCRQINAEASTLPFELNTFVLGYDDALERWTRTQVLAARALAEFVEPESVEVLAMSKMPGVQEPFVVLMKEKVTKVVKDAMGQEVEVLIAQR
ncbi:hypothetical protein SNOG_04356 [Parastagonospora nodorum SN15]|uniref:Uncharacterized protein n=1 Tax=Phaeosphaeria nodorum (strain SN15 / ATCC MYA-4574 / FGSC 10173) TaxID=321614 RepID=Q0UV58_PHANO|nr:hypothetical protein SNOG_04356 [Parastagonospora nodorum SN15]EAT88116.2 hypothetical protein SNOG_04356 [Parastagonospora nodorum SN15]